MNHLQTKQSRKITAVVLVITMLMSIACVGVTAALQNGITFTGATSSDATPTEATPTEATPTEATPTEATPTEATPTEVPTSSTEATPDEPTTESTVAPTTEPTTEPIDGLYIKVDGKYYPVEQGQTYTYSYYLYVPEKVEAVDATTFYDINGVQWIPQLDEDSEIDKEALFPVMKNSGVMLNSDVDGQIIYNASNIDGYKFKSEDSKLISTQFLVTAEKGVYEISTYIKTLADINDKKYIFDGEIIDTGISFGGIIEGVEPVEPTVAPTTEETTEQPTTEPTQEPTTEEPTSVEPTEEPSSIVPTEQPSSVEPTETQSTTVAPSTTSNSATDNNANNNNGKAVQTGSSVFAFIMLFVVLASMATVIVIRRKREN